MINGRRNTTVRLFCVTAVVTIITGIGFTLSGAEHAALREVSGTIMACGVMGLIVFVAALPAILFRGMADRTGLQFSLGALFAALTGAGLRGLNDIVQLPASWPEMAALFGVYAYLVAGCFLFGLAVRAIPKVLFASR